MGLGLVRQRLDVVRSKANIAKTLAPEKMPLTRWPSPGRHPLVLMQQAAINHSVVELANGGMVAINGPPGTGKTTLLRDIVAKVVLDRAIAMSKFDKPAQAFTHIAQMMTGRAYTHLYQLDQSLIGHEVVVASSNNKAVENISREIPASTAMAGDLSPQGRYFHSISDAVAAGKGPIKDGATWGLAAAVLGNSSNRSVFTQSFYWHKKRGIALYLKSILGGDLPEDSEEGGEEGGEPILDVVTIEQPPRGEIEALERWHIARRDFLAKLKKVEVLQKQAQAVYEAVTQRPKAVRAVADARGTLQKAEEAYVAAIDREKLAKRLHATAVDAERRAAEDRSAIDRLRPGFFVRLFNLRSYREWCTQMTVAHSALGNARMQLKSTADAEQHAVMDATLAKRIVRDCELEEKKLTLHLPS